MAAAPAPPEDEGLVARAKAPLTREMIDAYLEENQAIIDVVLAHQNAGDFRACATHLVRLQQNLLCLASDADARAEVRPLVAKRPREGEGHGNGVERREGGEERQRPAEDASPAAAGE